MQWPSSVFHFFHASVGHGQGASSTLASYTMHAAAMNLVVEKDNLETSLSQFQTVLLLASCTVTLLSALYRFMLERCDSGRAGGWTAPNEAVSPLSPDSDFQLSRLRRESREQSVHSDKAKHVSLTGQRGLLAWWTWWVDSAAPDDLSTPNTEFENPQRKPPDSSQSASHRQKKKVVAAQRLRRLEALSEEAGEATCKAGSEALSEEAGEATCKAGSEGRQDGKDVQDAQGARDSVENLPQVVPFQKRCRDQEPGFEVPQAPSQPQVLPFQRRDLEEPGEWTSPELPDVLPFQKKSGPEHPEPPAGIPPMPFQRKRGEEEKVKKVENLGHLGGDLQERLTAPEPRAWPLPFTGKYPHPLAEEVPSLSGLPVPLMATFRDPRRLATSADTQHPQHLSGLSQDGRKDSVKDWDLDLLQRRTLGERPPNPQTSAPLAWDPMGLNENVPASALCASLRLAALLPVPMPPTPCPPPGLPPPPPPARSYLPLGNFFF